MSGPGPQPNLTVKEIDGSPNVHGVNTIQVSGGTLTDNGGGNVTLTIGTGSGTVTSVSGTTNQINVATGTTTPVLSLSSPLILPGSLGIGMSPVNILDITQNQNAGSAISILNSTTGTASTSAVIATSDAAITDIVSHSTGRVALRYGVAVGGFGELASSGGNGLMIGTVTDNKPIIFGTNNLERMRIPGTGSLILTGATTTGPDVEVQLTGDTFSRVALGLNTADTARVSFGAGPTARDVFLERGGAANLRLGGPAVDTAPVAQTISVQNTLAGGTSNVAGANCTFAGSQGKGTGVGGSHIFQVAPAGSTGTTVNALENKFIVGPTGVTVSVAETTTGLTDLLINPTTKASGNFIDMQVASSSKASIDVLGVFRGTGLLAVNGSKIGWNSQGFIMSTGDGIWELLNNAQSDFGRLQFGGTSNSFNAISRDAVNGFTLQSAAATATWNDAVTAAAGTVANRYLFGIAAPTLTSTNTITDTVASSFYIGGAPTASTNTTIGAAYALNVAAGNIIFGSLAGTGSRAVLADANGVLSAPVSDSRLKTNVQTLDGDILAKLSQLRGVSFDFIPTEGVALTSDKRHQVGMIADEVEKVIPEAVGFNAPVNGAAYRYLNYDVLIPFLIEAVKAQQLEISALKLKVAV